MNYIKGVSVRKGENLCVMALERSRDQKHTKSSVMLLFLFLRLVFTEPKLASNVLQRSSSLSTDKGDHTLSTVHSCQDKARITEGRSWPRSWQQHKEG